MKKLLLLFIVLSLYLGKPADSCTIIMVSDSTNVFAGNNEDSVFPLTMIWFVPAKAGEYARVCLGYKMIFNSVQGGMNEKGLFIDGNLLSKQNWESEQNKKPFFGSILDRLLATCANIKDVKEFFNTYNVKNLDRARFPVMDKSGASMIVEWFDGKVVFLETDKMYQISSNFVESKYLDKEKPCWRYNNADKFLHDKRQFSLNTIKESLDFTHLNHENSKTVYSFICDLKKGDIHVYNFHDFNKSLKFNLKDELQKGKQEYFLSKLFEKKSEDYLTFINETGPIKMIERGYRSNLQNAFSFYFVLKTNYPTAFGKEISYHTLSKFGNQLLNENKIEDAILFFKKNASEFPNFSHTHYDLGNAYEQKKEFTKAKDCYNKALTIDSEFEPALKAIIKLSKQEN